MSSLTVMSHNSLSPAGREPRKTGPSAAQGAALTRQKDAFCLNQLYENSTAAILLNGTSKNRIVLEQ
jgi:hypothetical protein